MSDEIRYVYPVDELDKIIEQMMDGITPMIDDTMLAEVKLRWAERQKEEFGIEDEEELDPETMRQHNEIMKKKISDDRRKASRNDVIILTISDEQKAKIREEMSVSIVRPDPNDAYNIPNDQLCNTEARKQIYEKLKGIRNCYYNQTDYVNAFKIIQEAIDVSLGKYGDGDYPWLTYEEALKEFNAGRIKFSWCTIPKLYINHSTQITDREILKGVITGDVVLRDKRDDEKPKIKKQPYKPVALDYDVTGAEEYQRMLAAHNAGYDTPMSTVIRHKNTVYNPSAIPFGNRFARNNVLGDNNEPILYDWTKEGAGEEFFNLTRGRKPQSTDIIRFVDQQNDGMLNSVMTRNAQDFLKSMKVGSNISGGYDYSLPNFAQPTTTQANPNNYNEDAARVEAELLSSIRLNNPTR
jgi:5S rRNA maturation endonuclease (ribonuclease M5)